MFERRKIDTRALPAVLLAKWPSPLLDEGFVPLPKRLLRCFGSLLQGPEAINQLAVVLAVVDFQRPNLLHPPSIDFLAHTAGLTVDEFRRALRGLETRGMVAIRGPESSLKVDLSGFNQQVLALTEDHGE